MVFHVHHARDTENYKIPQLEHIFPLLKYKKNTYTTNISKGCLFYFYIDDIEVKHEQGQKFDVF